MRQHWSKSTLAGVMIRCLTAPSHYSVAEKFSWLIRHLSDGFYIFYSNLWSLIWAKLSEMSNVSDDVREHCITCINAGLSSVGFCGIVLKAISQVKLMISKIKHWWSDCCSSVCHEILFNLTSVPEWMYHFYKYLLVIFFFENKGAVCASCGIIYCLLRELPTQLVDSTNWQTGLWPYNINATLKLAYLLKTK